MQFELLHKGTDRVRRNSDESELGSIFAYRYAIQNKTEIGHPQAKEYAFNAIEAIKAASPEAVPLSEHSDVRFA